VEAPRGGQHSCHARSVGSCWRRFPSNKWYPPLITIDHILTRNAAASSIRTVEVPGSGHRALLATIAVPTG